MNLEWNSRSADMGIEYVNRRGERYYLLQGKTKTGKPKYYVSRKPAGVPVDQIPEGFELHEDPGRGLVSVRKTRPSPILPDERDTLERLIREVAGMEYFRVDIQEGSLVVYTPSRDPATAASVLTKLFGACGEEESSHREWIGNNSTYLPMFRFTLTDQEKRVFAVERWCFRGGIDGWFHLPGRKSLERLAQEYLPHLNKESFFELM
jgi:hypothetical protein